MAKTKFIRSMSGVGLAQQAIEKSSAEKFASVQELATQIKPIKEKASSQPSGRINPQLSCTITPEDKELLNELALYACNRERKILNTSVLIRALIKLGNKYKEELVF